MEIVRTKHFVKRFKKLPEKIQRKFGERLRLFLEDPNDKRLAVHPLKGIMAGSRAFSITGDYRAVFKYLNQDTILFIDVGTHNQVY